ncbi:MAG: hypothetical protein JSW04_11240 [Desulfobacterales bacterium]|nr:MAG: hypothetical protein JSV38_13640 [Desulfobacterales bacterium]UCD89010.1 MAG: hypothetical protein JSW04_11240 [Desulfobacterales bacterium]
MRQLQRNRQLTLILLICSFFFSACSGLSTRVSKREKHLNALETGKLLSSLRNQNLDLKTFKGVGRITHIKDGKKTLSNRIAWIGAAPDKFRTVLSSASGQPFLSFAGDAQWFYFFDHGKIQFYKHRADSSIIKRAFSVSIKLDDIVSILAGRIPIHQYRSAVLIKDRFTRKAPLMLPQGGGNTVRSGPSKGDKGGYILVLKRGWVNIQEKIYFYADKINIRKIEVFNLAGALAYRAEFDKMQNVNGYQVPAVIIFSNDEGSGFRLDVERYWPHVHVSPSMFVLSPPES